jgi:hypothetical protein
VLLAVPLVSARMFVAAALAAVVIISMTVTQTVQSQQYVTTTLTTVSIQRTSVYTKTLPGAPGACNGYFVSAPFDAGLFLTGSVTASGSVNVFVMTYDVLSTWEYKVGMGESCMPSKSVASRLNTTSPSISTAILPPPPSGQDYYFVVDNISGSTVTAQITFTLVSPLTRTQTIMQTFVHTPMQTTIQETPTQSVQTNFRGEYFAHNAFLMIGVVAVMILLIGVGLGLYALSVAHRGRNRGLYG